MACQACINRQRWLVKKLCQRGMTKICERAKARLAKMEARSK